MPAKFFGQFLLEKQIVTKDQLLSAMKHQKRINLPLCALAVENGYLSKDQLADLDVERKSSDKAFLDMVLRKKMLSFKQIGELSRSQSGKWISLGEALIADGSLTMTQLGDVFGQYRSQYATKTEGIDAVGLALEVRDVVAEVVSATIDMFVHYTKDVVTVKSVERVRGEMANIAYVFAQTVRGDSPFRYALALPEALTIAIANFMIDEETEVEVTPAVQDAVSEFVNIVVGHACTKLNARNQRVDAEPPMIMTKHMMKELLPSEVVTVRLKTASGRFDIMVFFEAS